VDAVEAVFFVALVDAAFGEEVTLALLLRRAEAAEVALFHWGGVINF
jgi:hypothetical protein